MIDENDIEEDLGERDDSGLNGTTSNRESIDPLLGRQVTSEEQQQII